MPEKITLSGTDDILYTYDAAGNKLKHTSTGGNKTFYSGSFVYMQPDNGTRELDYILFEEGRLLASDSNFAYEYHMKDHLGNTRVAFSDQDNNGSIVNSEISQLAREYTSRARFLKYKLLYFTARIHQ